MDGSVSHVVQQPEMPDCGKPGKPEVSERLGKAAEGIGQIERTGGVSEAMAARNGERYGLMGLARCESDCGNLVGPGHRYCSKCEEFYVDLESKRLGLGKPALREPTGEYERIDMGVSEESDFAAYLLCLRGWELVKVASVALCCIAFMAWIGWALLLGTRDQIAIFMRVWRLF